MQYAQPATKRGAKKETAAEGTEEEKKTLSNHAQRNLDEKKKGACVKCRIRFGQPMLTACSLSLRDVLDIRCEGRPSSRDSVRGWPSVCVHQQPTWPVWPC